PTAGLLGCPSNQCNEPLGVTQGSHHLAGQGNLGATELRRCSGQSRGTGMTRQIHHFINGQHTAGQSTRTADVMNPSTGKVQAKVVMGTAADIDAAVAGAAEAQKEW